MSIEVRNKYDVLSLGLTTMEPLLGRSVEIM
jgi:hypothetical protein